MREILTWQSHQEKTKSGWDSNETVGIEKIQEVRAIIMKRLNEKDY